MVVRVVVVVAAAVVVRRGYDSGYGSGVWFGVWFGGMVRTSRTSTLVAHLKKAYTDHGRLGPPCTMGVWDPQQLLGVEPWATVWATWASCLGPAFGSHDLGPWVFGVRVIGVWASCLGPWVFVGVGAFGTMYLGFGTQTPIPWVFGTQCLGAWVFGTIPFGTMVWDHACLGPPFGTMGVWDPQFGTMRV